MSGMEHITIEDGIATISILGWNLEDYMQDSEPEEIQIDRLKYSRDLALLWFDPSREGSAFNTISCVYGDARLVKDQYVVKFGGGLKFVFSIDIVFCELVYYVKLEKKNLGVVGSFCCDSIDTAVSASLKMLRSYMLPRVTSDAICELLIENGQ